MALTDTRIRNLKYPGRPAKYADGGGLYLYLSASGKKLWRMAYSFEQKEKVLSFGEYPVVTLEKAREKRLEAKQLLADSIDPGTHSAYFIIGTGNTLGKDAGDMESICTRQLKNTLKGVLAKGEIFDQEKQQKFTQPHKMRSQG